MGPFFSWRFSKLVPGALLALSISLPPNFAAQTGDGKSQEQPSKELKKSTDLSQEYMGLFQRVFNLVLRDYVDPRMPDSVIPGAIQGCAEMAGAESAYIPPDEVRAYQDLSRPVASLPMYLTKGEDFARVISCYPGTEKAPAAGDMLKSVNGRSTYDLTYPQLLTLARGQLGQKVECVFLKHDAFETYTLSMTCSELPKTGLIELSEGVVLTMPSLSSELAPKAVAALRGTKGDILIDLRGCAQADPAAALKTAGLLLGKGEGPVSKSQKGDIKHPIDGPGYMAGKRVRVAVDSSTARGGEVLAAALAEAGATILGEQTMGWAPEASDLRLKNGGLLRLNTAFFMAPDGKPINNHPIEPAIKITKGEGETDTIFYRRVLTAPIPKAESKGIASAAFNPPRTGLAGVCPTGAAAVGA